MELSSRQASGYFLGRCFMYIGMGFLGIRKKIVSIDEAFILGIY